MGLLNRQTSEGLRYRLGRRLRFPLGCMRRRLFDLVLALRTHTFHRNFVIRTLMTGNEPLDDYL